MKKEKKNKKPSFWGWWLSGIGYFLIISLKSSWDNPLMMIINIILGGLLLGGIIYLFVYMWWYYKKKKGIATIKD